VSLTMGDIGNCIDGLKSAIDYELGLIESNTPPGAKNKKARATWPKEDQQLFDRCKERLRIFRGTRKKLLAIERDA
jgi:hypothetical protein